MHLVERPRADVELVDQLSRRTLRGDLHWRRVPPSIQSTVGRRCYAAHDAEGDWLLVATSAGSISVSRRPPGPTILWAQQRRCPDRRLGRRLRELEFEVSGRAVDGFGISRGQQAAGLE